MADDFNILDFGAGGLSDIVQDLSPQLGGNLDPNGFDLGTPLNPFPHIYVAELNAGDVGAGAGRALPLIAGDAFAGSNADGGDITLTPGAGDGSGGDGQVLLEDGTNSRPALAFVADRDTGWRRVSGNRQTFISGGNRILSLTDVKIIAEEQGDATAPVYTFDADSNSGMFNRTGDELNFAAGGVELLRLTEGANDQILFGGTQSSLAPSISWISDPDTGMRNPSPNNIALSGGGADVLQLFGDGQGVIKIGTGLAPSGTNAIGVGTDTSVSAAHATALGHDATASGLRSVALGGSNFGGPVAGGDRSVAIAGGAAANATTGDFAVAIGSNASADANQAVAVGANAAADVLNGAAFGRGAVASGVSATALGDAAAASGEESTALGGNAIADRLGEAALVPKNFTPIVASTDARTSEFAAVAETTDATTTDLSVGAGGESIPIPSDSTLGFSIIVTARRTDADNESAAWLVEGAIDNNAGTTALVGTVSVTALGDDSAGTWTVDAVADDTADELVIQVTGEAAKMIRWVAHVRTSEARG